MITCRRVMLLCYHCQDIAGPRPVYFITGSVCLSFPSTFSTRPPHFPSGSQQFVLCVSSRMKDSPGTTPNGGAQGRPAWWDPQTLKPKVTSQEGLKCKLRNQSESRWVVASQGCIFPGEGPSLPCRWASPTSMTCLRNVRASLSRAPLGTVTPQSRRQGRPHVTVAVAIAVASGDHPVPASVKEVSASSFSFFSCLRDYPPLCCPLPPALPPMDFTSPP